MLLYSFWAFDYIIMQISKAVFITCQDLGQAFGKALTKSMSLACRAYTRALQYEKS